MPIAEAKYIWMNGKYVQWNEAKVHVLTHGLHYGTGVFEGIRAYKTQDNLVIFRLEDHMKRLARSAKLIQIPFDLSLKELCDATIELLRKNEIRESAYIRPIVFVGYGGIGLDFSGFPISAAISAFPYAKYFGKSALNVCTSTWRRIWDASLPPQAKACGNYLNSVLARMEARARGVDEAILLDHNGTVSEGSGENIFVVEDGKVATPPLSSSVLAGITRDSVIKLAHDEGISIVERPVSRAELYTADEVFFSGTAAEITPILQIDGRTIGQNTEGKVTAALSGIYARAVTGAIEKYREWLTEVYP